MQVKQTTVYVAKDGTEFTDRLACLIYEFNGSGVGISITSNWEFINLNNSTVSGTDIIGMLEALHREEPVLFKNIIDYIRNQPTVAAEPPRSPDLPGPR